jgi:hypothetical protein
MNSPSDSFELSHDAIASRAREIWHARNCPVGHDEEIWFEARRQLAAEWESTVTPSHRRPRGTAVDIDERELADELDEFGESSSRSPTSIDPTR